MERKREATGRLDAGEKESETKGTKRSPNHGLLEPPLLPKRLELHRDKYIGLKRLDRGGTL